VDEDRTTLWQNATGDDFREAQLPGVEDGCAGDWVEDQQQSVPGCLHEDRSVYGPNAVDRYAAELGLFPDNLAALDVDAHQRALG
jgi:hypothetical protein